MTATRVRLKELGEWGSGGTPLASRADFYGGEIPWLIIEDLNDGIVTRAARSITQSGLENSSAKAVPAGTLLVAMYGSIGKLGITGMPSATNQAMAFCICDPSRVEMRFLFFLLLHERGRLIHAGRGGTQQNISGEFLKDYEVLLPDLVVQRRMVQRLEQADRLVRTRRYARELADTFLPAAFLRLFGDPIENPNGFPIEPLESLIQPKRPISYGILMPGPDTPGGVPYIRVTDIQEGQVVVSSVRRTTREIDDAYERSKLKPGDLLLSIRGHVGRMAVVPPSLDDANITQDTARLATITAIEPHYLMGCLSSSAMQRRMDGLTVALPFKASTWAT